jgi:hypothetical protein
MRKLLLTFAATLIASASFALGTLTVTSPLNGDFVGASTTFNFRVQNAVVQVRVSILIAKNGGGPSTTLPTVELTPDAEGNASGTAIWSPGTAFPEGLYDVTVSATEGGVPYVSVAFQVTLDTTKPEITDFAPAENSFVNGSLQTITATIVETNVQEWRVKVNDQDIPDNTGTGNVVSVPWDPSVIEDDGEQTITISVKDEANNEETKTITVTLDRSSPEIIVLYPRPNQLVRPDAILGVSFDVLDAKDTSVDPVAIVVDVKRLNGTFIKRVGRRSYQSTGDTTSRWTGMVRVRLPAGITTFKIVITAVDKAGNVATTQEIPLVLGRGRQR